MQVLSILLGILLTLSTIVRAQQPNSQTSPTDQKHTALKRGDKEPRATLPSESDEKPDAKLAVYQVHRLGDKILALRSVRAKAFETARLAAVLWKHDETHARFLFEKALNLTIANANDPEARALSTLHRRVIALIARNDAEWAKRLIDSAAKREGENEGAKTSSGANIRTALGLMEEDASVAVQFAERSLQSGVNPAFLEFILTLRKKEEPEANRLFLQALLDVANIDFSFDEAFRAVALVDPEAAMAQAGELRHENLRAQSLVEVGRAFLDKLPPTLLPNEPSRVGEDGMRKSASKTVMPAYPDEAVKKREQGVAVVELQYDAKGDVVDTNVLETPSRSIGDAVIRAVNQWKFVPSKKQDGAPVSVRGKLTFYFEIDKEGKGLVQNPKQYR
jgi:TonB family protein